MREKDIEKIFVDEVKKLGGRAFKWVSPGNAGVPDRIVIFPGKPPVFVELKTETGCLTSLQQVQINRLRALGQEVAVVKGLDGASQFFKTHGFEQTGSGLDRRFRLHREGDK